MPTEELGANAYRKYAFEIKSLVVDSENGVK